RSYSARVIPQRDSCANSDPSGHRLTLSRVKWVGRGCRPRRADGGWKVTRSSSEPAPGAGAIRRGSHTANEPGGGPGTNRCNLFRGLRESGIDESCLTPSQDAETEAGERFGTCHSARRASPWPAAVRPALV